MVQKENTLETPQVDGEPSPSPVSGEPCAEAPGPVEETVIGVETTGLRKFISGVVEGFYGRPWTMEQRKELFRRQQKWGLNTYLYAPKDDCKHRMFWRELYSVEEAEQLMTLIGAANEHGIEFIYAISPGLDITFSNQKEVSALKRKLDQVTHFGCKSFALLFDDIDHNMCPADKEVFSSFAHAQVSITNEIYQYLGEPETFLFCPTEYCGTFCYPNVSQSPYLHTVGEKLLPDIDVLWTGPKVVSKDITVESIEEVSKILRRAPVIWDNIHANDYDQKRLFLGPYKGRSTELIPRLKGVLTNPNCEFESNFVAIHTLATWYKSNMNGVRKDVVMTDGEDSTVSIQIKLENEGSDEELETDILYSPQLALKLALTEWLGEFGVPHQYNIISPLYLHLKAKTKLKCLQSLIIADLGPQEVFVPGPNEKALFTAEPLTLEDLCLLAELFYLPYEHGPKAMQMLKEFNWLRANSSVVSVNCKRRESEKVTEWQSRAEKFEEMCCSVIQMFTRLSNTANRTILYDLYPYLWDIKSIISMVKSFVQWLGCRSQSSAQFLRGDQEPWAFRGGLAGEFQRLLPIDGANDLFYQPPPSLPTSKIYTIRPYFPKDETAVYKICKEMYCEGMEDVPFSDDDPDLIGDRLVGGLLTLSSDYGFVLEDDEGICGYALGTVDVKPFIKKCKLSWIPFMQEKYHKPDCDKDLTEAEMILSFHEEEEGLPDSFLSNFPSLIKVDIHAKVTDPSVAKSMMGCLLSSLKANGSRGAFCKVRQTDKRMLDFYSKLGCFEVAKMEGFPKDIIIMGRSL
ncbi:ceramide synthetase [Sarotherodon galilaeus]